MADHAPASAEDERAQNEAPVDRGCAGLLELRGSKRPAGDSKTEAHRANVWCVYPAAGFNAGDILEIYMIIAINRPELLVPSFPFN